jgi:hypothetical protein
MRGGSRQILAHVKAQGWINQQISTEFVVFTAVIMMNVVCWDIKTQFVLHRRHITSPLQSPAS